MIDSLWLVLARGPVEQTQLMQYKYINTVICLPFDFYSQLCYMEFGVINAHEFWYGMPYMITSQRPW